MTVTLSRVPNILSLPFFISHISISSLIICSEWYKMLQMPFVNKSFSHAL